MDYLQPAIKSHYRILTSSDLGDEGTTAVFLLSEEQDLVITDPVQVALLTQIDGNRDLQSLYEQLDGKITIEAIADALEELDFAGILTERDGEMGRWEKERVRDYRLVLPPTPESPSDRYISIETIGLSNEITQTFANVLQENAIAVCSDPVGIIPDHKNFSASGASSVPASVTRDVQPDTISDPLLRVVIVNDYLADELAVINQQALASKTPWLLVKPVGAILWIGPLFEPQKTACWECLAQRLRGNRPVREYLQRHYQLKEIQGNIDSDLPSSKYLAASLTADAIAKWLHWGENPAVGNNIVTFDSRSLTIENHPVTKRPQCPTCGVETDTGRRGRGDAGTRGRGDGENWYHNTDGHPPLKLQPRCKTCFSNNGHRIASPEQLLQRLTPYISPISGVIRSFAKFDSGDDAPVHTYISRHEFRCLFDDLSLLQDNLRGRSAGKGTTDVQAKASAFCEAIERYCGVYQGNEPTRRDRYRELGELAILPNHCLLFSEHQYQNREQLNRDCIHYFQYIPEPFDPEQAIDWTPVWSLTEKRSKWLPTAYCYHGYPVTKPAYCWADTNGTSAGNAIEEAIFQGMMELVERDAVAIWWYNRLRMPGVDLDSFAHPYIRHLQEYFDHLERDVWVLDVSHDLGIPVFVALSRRRNAPAEDILFGAGAHLDPQIAILRSLTEVNQSLPAVSVYDGNCTVYPPIQTDSDRAVLSWWTTATIANQPYLLPHPHHPQKQARDYPQLWSEDILEDIQWCQQQIERAGLELLVLDQTRPDIDLNVVKVIIPGLRHFWRRLAWGRLYEVPVKLNLQQTTLTESALNPIPLFL
ncbi:MAG: TOMM precursor leader peptide-binding protein [Symploca sp. SIO2E6]|nr:TOMM precursor leader peptide-binding protein [Symploca sp. SIO2E6]